MKDVDVRLAVTLAEEAGEVAVREAGDVHWYPCGFARVNARSVDGKKIRKGSAIGKALESMGFSHDSYQRCYYYWVTIGGQSMTLKEIYGYAFAKVLRDRGIEAYCSSTID